MVILTALAYWGGMPERNQGLFLLGVGSLLVMLALLVLLGWVLLAKPLAKGERLSRSALRASQRQLLALALTVSSISIVVGGYWDEVWHTQYGVPFGDDFFWRPHLLMYFGLGSVVLLALTGLWLLGRQPGSWPARFRSNRPVAYLALLGAFLLYVVPADPAWHFIYGEDLSAWSLPHIFLAVSFALISITAVAFLLSTMPERKWELLRLTPHDALIITALAFALTILLQLMTTEWDALGGARRSPQAFWQRPEWLLPVVVTFLATFVGTLALHTTRRAGSATAVGLIALGVRFALLNAFELRTLSADAWLVSLPVLMAVDCTALGGLRRAARTPVWWHSGLGATVGMAAVGLPLVSALFVYPEVSARALPMMLLMTLVMAAFASWSGTRLGDGLTAHSEPPKEAAKTLPLRWATPLGLALVLGFVAYYIGTAAPPV